MKPKYSDAQLLKLSKDTAMCTEDNIFELIMPNGRN